TTRVPSAPPAVYRTLGLALLAQAEAHHEGHAGAQGTAQPGTQGTRAAARQEWARRANGALGRALGLDPQTGQPSRLFGPEDVALLRATARARLLAGQPAEAVPLLKDALGVVFDTDGRLAVLGDYVRALLAAEQPAEALARVREALRARPDDRQWLAWERDALEQLNRPAEALAVARRLTTHGDVSAADWLAQARLARGAGEPVVAAHAVIAATALAPDSPAIHTETDATMKALAQAHEQAITARQWQPALDLLNWELRLAPDRRDTRLLHAEMLKRVGRTDDALRAARALESGVRTASDWLALGALYVVLGLPADAWASIQRVTSGGSPGSDAALDRQTLALLRALVALPGAGDAAWLAFAHLTVATGAPPQDTWTALQGAERSGASPALVGRVRGELFPLPTLPPRLAQLGFAAHNLAGVKLIVPPLCPVAAGPFLMGSDPRRDSQAQANEQPQHEVTLAAFAIATFPVTVAEYACFVASGHAAPGNWSTQQGRLEHPVTSVTWHDATAYAAWLAQATGQPWRLPTEADWEKAARWDTARRVARLYPWGDSFDKARCNTRESGIGHTTAVGSYGPEHAARDGSSPCGAQELAGNVWEWTSSLVQPYPNTPDSGRENGDSTENRMLRGGSWNNDSRDARAAYRSVSRPADATSTTGSGSSRRRLVHNAQILFSVSFYSIYNVIRCGICAGVSREARKFLAILGLLAMGGAA
ncbi:MAG: SUMF1/EgtB/PvdO family nonheme iron enzyme, partial [Ktedonobacterales bacterium]